MEITMKTQITERFQLRAMTCATICTMMSLLVTANLYGADDSTRVSNVRFVAAGNELSISYDLAGPNRDVTDDGSVKYTVSVQLRRDQNPSFVYIPTNVRGNVGANIAPGTNKKILWDFSREFPQGLSGDDFYFVVNAEPTVASNHTYLWLGATAAILGGAAASILFLHKGAGTAQVSFPDPPRRPQ
jgi:hypothetical protein